MSKRQKNLFHLRKILSNGFGGKTEMRPGANFVLPFPRTEGYAQELPLINKSYIFFLSNLWFVCVCMCVWLYWGIFVVWKMVHVVYNLTNFDVCIHNGLLKWHSGIKSSPAVQETWVWSLGQEDPLEKGMPTHSSILAWRIPWTEEPGRLQSMGSQRVRQDSVTNSFIHLWSN